MLRDVAVFATPAGVDSLRFSEGSAVVIDVLRATTSAAMALAAGAQALVPVAAVEDAFAARAVLGERGCRALLCGEREGVRVPGFDLGNSPLEYTPDAVVDRILVQCSTNGTGAMVRCAGFRAVFLAAFVNAAAVAAAVPPGPVALVCSGKEGNPCAEDLALAGCLLEAWGIDDRPPGAPSAWNAWRRCRSDPAEFLAGTEHGRYLATLGFASDLAACAARDRVAVVPGLTRSQDGILAGLLAVRSRPLAPES